MEYLYDTHASKIKIIIGNYIYYHVFMSYNTKDIKLRDFTKKVTGYRDAINYCRLGYYIIGVLNFNSIIYDGI